MKSYSPLLDGKLLIILDETDGKLIPLNVVTICKILELVEYAPVSNAQDKNLFVFINPFLHQTTTYPLHHDLSGLVFINPFLHQTTTDFDSYYKSGEVFINPFLHQTTTMAGFR